MSIEFLTDNHQEKIISTLHCSTQKICIVTPFLSESSAKMLKNCLDKKEISCTLITRFKHSDFYQKSNSLEGLSLLLDANIRLLALQGLHTKLYLIDNSIAILGSANFTSGGLQNNHELSVYIENEPELIQELIAYFEMLENTCVGQKDGIISREIIASERSRLQEESSPPNISKSEYTYGAVLAKKKSTPASTSIPTQGSTPTVWLKFVGYSDSLSTRIEESAKPYQLPHSKTLNIKYVSFPEKQKPSGIKKNDIVYIAFLGWDNEKKKRCAFIVGRGISAGFDPAQPAYSTLLSECPNEHKGKLDRWPIYLELINGQVFPGNKNEAMPISEVWDKEGRPRGFAPRGSHIRVFSPDAIELLETYSKQFKTIID